MFHKTNIRQTWRLVTGHRDGFTLLEILVALAILTITLVTLIQSISGDLRGIDRNRSHTIGLLHAQSKMAEVQAWSELEPGHWRGKFEDRYSWEVDIVRAADSGEPEPGNKGSLLRISVRTFVNPGEAIIELSTLRIGHR